MPLYPPAPRSTCRWGADKLFLRPMQCLRRGTAGPWTREAHHVFSTVPSRRTSSERETVMVLSLFDGEQRDTTATCPRARLWQVGPQHVLEEFVAGTAEVVLHAIQSDFAFRFTHRGTSEPRLGFCFTHTSIVGAKPSSGIGVP